MINPVYIFLIATRYLLYFAEARPRSIQENYGNLKENLWDETKEKYDPMPEEDQPLLMESSEDDIVLDNGKKLENIENADEIYQNPYENLYGEESTVYSSQPAITTLPSLSDNGFNLDLADNKNNYDDSYQKSDILSMNMMPETTSSELNVYGGNKSPDINANLGKRHEIVKYVERKVQEDIYAPKEWDTFQTVSKKMRFARDVSHKREKDHKIYKNKFNRMQNGNRANQKKKLTGIHRDRTFTKKQIEITNSEDATKKQGTPNTDLKPNTESSTKAAEEFRTQDTNFEVPETTSIPEKVNVDTKYGSRGKSNLQGTTNRFLNESLQTFTSTMEVFSNYRTEHTTGLEEIKFMGSQTVTQNKQFLQNTSKHDNKSLDIQNMGQSKVDSSYSTTQIYIGTLKPHRLSTESETQDIYGQQMATENDYSLQNKLRNNVTNEKFTLNPEEYESNSDKNYTLEKQTFTTQNSSNVVDMHFDFDVPDSNFSLSLNSRDVNGKGAHEGNVGTNNRRKRKFKKIKDINRKLSFYDSFVRNRRQLKGLIPNTEKLNTFAENVPTGSFESFTPSFRRFPAQNNANSSYISYNKMATENNSIFMKENAPDLTAFQNAPVPTFGRIFLPGRKSDFSGISTPSWQNSQPGSSNLYSNDFRDQVQSTSSYSSVFNSDFGIRGDSWKNQFTDELENEEFLLNLIMRNASEFYKLPLRFLDPNSSSLMNESFIELNGTKAFNLLYLPFLRNSSLLKDIESGMWNNVHYIKERNVWQNTHSCCQPSLLNIIERNPFTVAMAFAVCCLVLVVIFTGVFFMAEKRFENKRSAAFSDKDPSDYKVIKNKNQIAHGKIRRSVSNPDQLTREENIRIKKSSKGHTGISAADETKTDKKYLSKQKTESKTIKGENSDDESEKDRLLSQKRKFKKPRAEAKGVLKKAQKLGRWIRRRISNVFWQEESAERDSSTDAERSGYSLHPRSSNSDKTYVSKRQRLMRFVDSKSKREKSPRKITQRQVAPDLRSTVKEISLDPSADETPIPIFPAMTTDLRERLITTGDCKEIDDMLIKVEWERTLYTAHGIDKIEELKEEAWMDYMPEERRKVDAEKIAGTPAQSIGILSKGSSSRSLKTAVGRSLYTAEWISKHPRPLSRTELKTRYGR